MTTGLLFALLATVLNSAAGLLQSDAARRAGPGRPLLTQRRYLVGLGIDGLGWICTVVALRHLPVFAVQAVLGSAMALTALASRALYGTVLRPADRFAVGACLAGLVLVAAGAGSGAPPAASARSQIVLCCAAGVLALALLALRGTRHAAPLAVLAGLGFGATSIAVRAIHPDGIPRLLTQPAVYLVVCFWLVGLIAYTRALKLGSLALVTAVYLVTEVTVPGIAGIALLGDTVRAGWELPMALGLALAAGGVLVLSGSPAHHGTARASAAPNG